MTISLVRKNVVLPGEIGAKFVLARRFHQPALTQEAMADNFPVSRSLIAKIETGEREPSTELVRRLAEAIDVPDEWFYDGQEGNPPVGTRIQRDPVERVRLPRTKGEPSGRIKIYGAASAGLGNTSSIDAQELDVPMQFARDDYGALVVEGDSMMPFLHSSDIAIFRDWYQPKEGAVMAASLANGDWVIKLLVYEHGRYLLRSLNGEANPPYPDITMDFKLGGYLVGYVRDDGAEREIRLNGYGLRPKKR